MTNALLLVAFGGDHCDHCDHCHHHAGVLYLYQNYKLEKPVKTQGINSVSNMKYVMHKHIIMDEIN